MGKTGKTGGRIGKPQKKKKNKFKTYGWHKNDDKVNRAPKCMEQEVPRRLRDLGLAIKEVQAGKKNRNRNKFKLNLPDGPDPNRSRQPVIKGKKYELKSERIKVTKEEWEKNKLGKKMKKMTASATEEYIDTLKPTRPLLENFKFKQKAGETDKQFLKRVESETNYTLTQSKIADSYDMNEKDTIQSIVKSKLVAERREKKKQILKEAEESFSNAGTKNKDKEIKDFSTLKDDIVAFGEVAHAPPSLSVLPRRAKSQGYDRPGARMPELQEAFAKVTPVKRKTGETVKRKNLSAHQQFESDKKREQFVEAYRQMKKKRKLT